LSLLNSTLTEKVLASLYGMETSRQVWTHLSTRFASESRSHIAYVKRQLQHLHQGSQSCTDYLQSAKLWADKLAVVGKPVDDDDLVSYVLSGLNASYGPFVTTLSINTRNSPITFEDFQAELLSHEIFLDNHHNSIPPGNNSFAMFSNRKPPNHFSNRKSHGPMSFASKKGSPNPYQGHSLPRESAPHSSGSATSHQFGQTTAPKFGNKPPCQICGKLSHQALDCFHQMDYAYQWRHPPPQLAAMAAQNNAFVENQQ
jgi:hypothetical protein